GAWFSVLCMRSMRCHSNRLISDLGGYSPKTVSSAELIQNVASDHVHEDSQTWLDEREIPSFEQCSEMMAVIMSGIHARTEATFEAHGGETLETILPAESLRQAFSLSDTDLTILICLALVQYDDRFARAWRYVSGEQEYARMTVGSLMMLLDFIPKDELRKAFHPDSPLRRHALIQFGIRENWGRETPIAFSPVFIPNRLVSYLLAEPCHVAIPGCRILESESSQGKPAPIERDLQRTMQKKGSHVALIGYTGLGRTTAFVRAAQKFKTVVYELDLARLCESNFADDALGETFAEVIREIRLKRAMLLIRMCQVDEDNRRYLERHVSVIANALSSRQNLFFAVTLDRQTALSRMLFGELTEIVFPAPSRDDQPQFWEHALSPYLRTEYAHTIANEMAVGYCLSESEIRGVVEQTLARRANMKPAEALSTEILTETLNKTRGQRLEGLATLRSTSLYLKDIVLSDNIRDVLNEVLSYARYRDTVMRDWGFAKYNLSGAGLSVLLSGVPGTGKTMTALVLAHELRRALYVVDISRIVDKYIGETEKRLAQIFDEAERSQAMLLFDEADSLFAKRTDVKSSNDRYANLEVNYLLQRLEAYSGVSILTTNFGGGLDEALARRIQFKIDFPMPDISQRIELWRRLIPPAAPLAQDVDFPALAEYFEMSGGHIKNADFRASIQAATKHSMITHDLLWEAALHEYREMGHVIRDENDQDETHRWN
ncbi:MAG: ATP-binding protein, partial [Proteobacteria bacterium]|nr:ATP-binding protein [Pseudomonadota bacterium]